MVMLFFASGNSEEVGMLKQQLEEMKTAQESYKSLAAELDILKMEKNEIIGLKDTEIEELKGKLSSAQSENHIPAGSV